MERPRHSTRPLERHWLRRFQEVRSGLFRHDAERNVDRIGSYDGVDVVNFLKKEFTEGKVVNAFDGKQWCRGELLARPTLVSRSKPSPEDPNKKEQVLQCRVQSHGKVFTTERVRHGDAIQKLLHSVGKDQFLEIVKQILPDDVKIVRP